MLPFLVAAQIAAASDAGALVAKARLARYQQDSALAEYRAVAKQRMSASIGMSSMFGVGVPGPEKLASRYESVARVGWSARAGAWGDVIGSRGVAPLVGQTEPDGDAPLALVLPYYPGSDALWPMTELRGAFHDHRDWITHPLDAGSDSLYEFSLGDSLTIRQPGGSVIRLREIVVRPRRPSERLIVGSLWVDVDGGNLVRAAYRPSTPVDLFPLIAGEMEGDSREDKNAVKRLGPYTGMVREVIIESGLYQGRFWLPRVRSARGDGTAHGVRASISIDQSFSYEFVRADDPVVVARDRAEPKDTTDTDRTRFREWNGHVVDGPCRQRGDSSAQWSPDSLASGATRLPVEYVQGIRFRILAPCDEQDMVHSPALPGSIFGDGEALFTDVDFARLRHDVEGALSMDRQARFQPQPTVITWGLARGATRYNRVEGLSVGAIANRILGNGYASEYIGRIGLADRQPNGEATLSRSNIRSEWRATAFRRLVAANEWGDPFGLGPSGVALVFGRDDGMYYRTLGAEASGFFRRSPEGMVWRWRLYGQREDSARVRTQFSGANAINGVRFMPNIQAEAGNFAGASLVALRAWGSNPRGTRLSGLWRADGAVGESDFGRASLDLTVSQGIGQRTEAALTASAGSTVGRVPVQRLWYLGGPQSVRGFAPGAMVGDAFWFGRFEITQGHPLIRPSLFVDAGWAGSRKPQPAARRPISGVGLGVSFMDGLLRLDGARSSAGRFRIDLYLDPR